MVKCKLESRAHYAQTVGDATAKIDGRRLFKILGWTRHFADAKSEVYTLRQHLVPHRRPVPLPPGNGASTGTLLIDGQWQANWKIARDKARDKASDQAVLHVQPFVRLLSAQADAVAAGGRRLLDFTVPGANYEVRFAPVS